LRRTELVSLRFQTNQPVGLHPIRLNDPDAVIKLHLSLEDSLESFLMSTAIADGMFFIFPGFMSANTGSGPNPSSLIHSLSSRPLARYRPITKHRWMRIERARRISTSLAANQDIHLHDVLMMLLPAE
jgi:hypothetical protein